MLLANTAILSACSVAAEMWEWGSSEGELRSRVRDSCDEAELEPKDEAKGEAKDEAKGEAKDEAKGSVRGLADVLGRLDTLLLRSRSVLRQLDSSCLDK